MDEFSFPPSFQNDNSSSFSPLDVVILDRDTGLSPAVLSLADPEDQAYFELQQTGSDPDAGSVTYTLLRTDQTFDFETQRSYQVDLLITVTPITPDEDFFFAKQVCQLGYFIAIFGCEGFGELNNLLVRIH